MEEVWKDVPGYDGVYQVSNFGNVRSVKPMKQRIINSGYLQVSFYKNQQEKHYLVHRLVAELFCKNQRNCSTVNHKDENKLNNRSENLEWCTQKENNNYGTARKRMIEAKGKPVLQFSVDGKLINRFQSAIEAERITGYDHSTISKVCLGRYSKYKGFIWKFE